MLLIKKKNFISKIRYIYLICEIHKIMLFITKNQIFSLKLIKEIFFIINQLFKIEYLCDFKFSKYYFDLNDFLVDNYNFAYKYFFFFLFEKNSNLIKLNFFKDNLFFLIRNCYEKSLYSTAIVISENLCTPFYEKTNNLLFEIKIKNFLYQITNKIDNEFYIKNINIFEIKKIMKNENNFINIINNYKDFLKLNSIKNYFLKYLLKLAYNYILNDLKLENKTINLNFINPIQKKIFILGAVSYNFSKNFIINNLRKNNYCVLLKKYIMNKFNENDNNEIFCFFLNKSEFIKRFFSIIFVNSRKIKKFVFDYILLILLNTFFELKFKNQNNYNLKDQKNDRSKNYNDFIFSIHLYNFSFLFFSFFCYAFENNFLDISKNFINCYFSIFTFQKNFIFKQNYDLVKNIDYHFCNLCKDINKEEDFNYYNNIINYINFDFIFKSIYKKYFVMEENKKNLKKSLKRLTISNTKKTEQIIDNSFLFQKLIKKKNFQIFLKNNSEFLNKKSFQIQIN